jgi:expansin (peptidoglycan-binding protein)
MKLHFRLKIEELNDGTKKYYVQKGNYIKVGRWIKIPKMEFNDYTGGYDTEEKALEVLETIKSSILEKELKKVKSTKYKLL